MTHSLLACRNVLQGVTNSAILKTLIIFGRGSVDSLHELRALAVLVTARTDTDLKQ
jgi:hypothetical protein